RWFVDAFEQVPSRTPTDDPLKIIFDVLGIRRAITTNYDTRIEDELARHTPPPPLQDDTSQEGADEKADRRHVVLSIKHRTSLDGSTAPADDIVTSAEALALFAAAAPGYESGVFHCHGLLGDPDSMIITERDYQRAYLSPVPASRAYRQGLELLFS